jgi:hypothetical protein
VLREKVSQGDILVVRNNDSALKVPPIELYHCLSTTTTRRQDSVARHGHDELDAGFPVPQHLSDCRNFRAKPKAARQVETDAGVDVALGSQNGGADASR